MTFFYIVLCLINRDIYSKTRNIYYWEKERGRNGKVIFKEKENKREQSFFSFDGQGKQKDEERGPSLVWQHIIAWRADYGIARDQVQG